jgi:hypothetical protein
MRTFKFDYEEFRDFDDKVSEEEVEVVVVSPAEVAHYGPKGEAYFPPTAAEFADRILGKGARRRLQAPVAFSATREFDFDRRRIERAARMSIPVDCAWDYYLIEYPHDDPLWRECIIDAADAYIFYRWSSTA